MVSAVSPAAPIPTPHTATSHDGVELANNLEHCRTRDAQLLRDSANSQPPSPQSGHLATVCIHSLRTSKPHPSLSRGGQTRTDAFYRCRARELLDCIEHAQKRFTLHLGSVDVLI